MWDDIDWKNPNEFQKNLRYSIYSLPKTLRRGAVGNIDGVHVASSLQGAKKVRTQCRNIGLEAHIFKLVWPDELEEVDA